MSPLHSLSTAPAPACCPPRWLVQNEGWMLLFPAVVPVPRVPRVLGALWCSGGDDLSPSSRCSWSHRAQWEEQQHGAPAAAPTWEPHPPPVPVASPDSTRGKSRVQAMFPDLPLPKIKLLHENIYFPPMCTHCKNVMKNIAQRTTLTSSFSQVPSPVWAGDALRTAVQRKNTPIWKLQIYMKRRDFDAGRQKL